MVSAPCVGCLACDTNQGRPWKPSSARLLLVPGRSAYPAPPPPPRFIPGLQGEGGGGGGGPGTGVAQNRAQAAFPGKVGGAGRGWLAGSELIPAASSARLARQPCRPRRLPAPLPAPHGSLVSSRDPSLQPPLGTAADILEGQREGLLARGVVQARLEKFRVKASRQTAVVLAVRPGGCGRAALGSQRTKPGRRSLRERARGEADRARAGGLSSAWWSLLA